MILLKILNEKMKKVLFLMFLLFLGLGTASVKAQVRIGGNTAPNAAAALDLNATDATNNGTKGLVLPRVNLTSNTMQLTSGVANINGMLVYHTNTSAGPMVAGLYVSKSGVWMQANIPSTSAADSGKILTNNGTYAYWGTPGVAIFATDSSIRIWPQNTVTWTKMLDTTMTLSTRLNSRIRFIVPAMTFTTACFVSGTMTPQVWTGNTFFDLWTTLGSAVSSPFHIICYKPS